VKELVVSGDAAALPSSPRSRGRAALGQATRLGRQAVAKLQLQQGSSRTPTPASSRRRRSATRCRARPSAGRVPRRGRQGRGGAPSLWSSRSTSASPIRRAEDAARANALAAPPTRRRWSRARRR
jgi:hypothetical protein